MTSLNAVSTSVAGEAGVVPGEGGDTSDIVAMSSGASSGSAAVVCAVAANNGSWARMSRPLGQDVTSVGWGGSSVEMAVTANSWEAGSARDARTKDGPRIMSRQTSSTAEGSSATAVAKGGEGGTRRGAAFVRRTWPVDVGRMALVRRAKPPTRALPARVVEVTTVADEPVGAEGHVEVTVGVVCAPGLKLK